MKTTNLSLAAITFVLFIGAILCVLIAHAWWHLLTAFGFGTLTLALYNDFKLTKRSSLLQKEKTEKAKAYTDARAISSI